MFIHFEIDYLRSNFLLISYVNYALKVEVNNQCCSLLSLCHILLNEKNFRSYF